MEVTDYVLDDCPYIESEIYEQTFQIILDGKGGFEVKVVGSDYVLSDDSLYCVEEMVENHMFDYYPFFNDKDDYLYAVDDIDIGEIEQLNLDKIIINGQDYPEAYEKFKVDKWVINKSTRMEYDHRESGYDNDGNYVVVLNMPMDYIGGTMLVHEIKHAYDDWNRISKGYPSINDSWEVRNIYTPDFEKLVLGGSLKLGPMLHPIIRYYYLASKLETPAYLENEYDNSNNIDYGNIAKKLINFKASNFMNKKGKPAKGLQDSWQKMLIDYDIPYFRKYPNVVDFLKKTEKYFNMRGRDIQKRINKMRYVHNTPKPKNTPNQFKR